MKPFVIFIIHILSFDYLAGSLPYPLDTLPRSRRSRLTQADAAKLVPFIEEMHREMLTVRGLEGNYKLLIDGEDIGIWTGDRLARGINLAEQTWTPQYRQALAVMQLNEYRWEIERTFRELAWIEFNFFQSRGMLFAYDRASVERLDREKRSNGWYMMHREIYSKYMHPTVRQAREQEIETLIANIYEINKLVTRKVVLHKAD